MPGPDEFRRSTSNQQAQNPTYAETARSRARARRQRLEARRQWGLVLAHQAAVLLQSQFGAGRVVVFGSVLSPHLFHERSDIDLAVWGLDERLYLRALAALLDLDPDIPVDLVEFEQVRPELQSVIERDGQPL